MNAITATPSHRRRPDRARWVGSFLLVFALHVAAVVGLPESPPERSVSAAVLPIAIVAFAPAAPKQAVVLPEPEMPLPEIKAVEVSKAEPIVPKPQKKRKLDKTKPEERRPKPVPEPQEEVHVNVSPTDVPPAPQLRTAAVDADFMAGRPSSGPKPDYLAIISAWLEKHKDYPRRARMRGQEGVVMLSFVMNRDGRVLSHQIEKGSGHALLDREVEALIARAQPLPPMPREMQQAKLELTVPVQFSLR